MIDVRPVLCATGCLLLLLALAMAVPALADVAAGDGDWAVFTLSAGVTAAFALALALGFRPAGPLSLGGRQSFLLTVLAWTAGAAFAALPFAFCRLALDPVDALFEAMSGLTTTGATVIRGLDHAPKGILLWRALLNWLGGAGILVMGVAILPSLRIGGMQVFRMESSDKTEMVKARIVPVAGGLVLIYAALTVAAALAFWIAGMGRFDAACHALAAVSTGGFSTRDARLAAWGPEVQWVAVAAMLAGASNLGLWVGPRRARGPGRGGRPGLIGDSQTRWYLTFLATFSGLITVWLWAEHDMAFADALRHATFSVVSVVSTTGFASTDWAAWGGFAQVCVFLLLFVGGCTGSTAGGIKILRWDMLFVLARVHLGRVLHPHGVAVIRHNGAPVPAAALDSMLGFVVLYFLTFALFAVALSVVGVDLQTALTGSASALANVGPGLGGIIGPLGTHAALPDAAKLVLSFEMLLGRLELFIVAVLFSRSYWQE